MTDNCKTQNSSCFLLLNISHDGMLTLARLIHSGFLIPSRLSITDFPNLDMVEPNEVRIRGGIKNFVFLPPMVISKFQS